MWQACGCVTLHGTLTREPIRETLIFCGKPDGALTVVPGAVKSNSCMLTNRFVSKDGKAGQARCKVEIIPQTSATSQKSVLRNNEEFADCVARSPFSTQYSADISMVQFHSLS